jgi:DNA-binding SARP family transcriptional activator
VRFERQPEGSPLRSGANPAKLRGGTPARQTSAIEAELFRGLVDQVPSPVLLIGTGRRIIYANAMAMREVSTDARTCCDAVCGDECLTRAALRHSGVPRARILLPQGRTWSVVAVRLPDSQAVALYLHDGPGESAAMAAHKILHLDVLGPTRISVEGRSIGGDWLDHRPGQLLKYLVAARGRAVSVDELLDALWPAQGPSGVASVRQAVHNLRTRLDPERQRQDGPGFVNSHRGAYSLTMGRVRLDVDAFERLATAGLTAAERGQDKQAELMLSRAAELYRGDFLRDDPFAEWAMGDRHRLRSLATQVLRALAQVKLAAGDLGEANARLERLADLDPLDLATQRDLISVMLKRGRHSDAARRYELVRHRYRRAFGQDPGFRLAELASRR